jgi:hypothetical protein
MTSQGVSALDEHSRIEAQPPSDSYRRLRDGIRMHYRLRYGAPERMPGSALPLNPGNGWVSALCFEPQVAVAVIEAMLAPHIERGALTVLREHVCVQARSVGRRVEAVRVCAAEDLDAHGTWLHAKFFVDATEHGDLLPMSNTGWVKGAESRADTGEAHAADSARPEEIQSFTCCFAIEHRPGESHVIPEPPGYAAFKHMQPYSLEIHNPTRRFGMFAPTESISLPFWTYRRLVDAKLLDPAGVFGLRDIALINWPGNDYHHASLIGVSHAERARVLQDAKNLSLGFLHWLQTECPRDDGSGYGYPGLRLMPEVMGTQDGLAKAPYVRESRRIVACTRIVEQDVRVADGPVARQYDDSVGIGWYHLDLHPAVGQPTLSLFEPTHPFQIPMGALIPVDQENLLAACKNIGTTHISNGAYRLHPVEWAIGEAAGTLAAASVRSSQTPQAIWRSPDAVQQVQAALRARGVRIAWDQE